MLKDWVDYPHVSAYWTSPLIITYMIYLINIFYSTPEPMRFKLNHRYQGKEPCFFFISTYNNFDGDKWPLNGVSSSYFTPAEQSWGGHVCFPPHAALSAHRGRRHVRCWNRVAGHLLPVMGFSPVLLCYFHRVALVFLTSSPIRSISEEHSGSPWNSRGLSLCFSRPRASGTPFVHMEQRCSLTRTQTLCARITCTWLFLMCTGF